MHDGRFHQAVFSDGSSWLTSVALAARWGVEPFEFARAIKRHLERHAAAYVRQLGAPASAARLELGGRELLVIARSHRRGFTFALAEESERAEALAILAAVERAEALDVH